MKQSQYALSAWDYVMFAGLFVVSAGIGLFFAFRERKRVRNADDYLMGGRGMHAIPVAISMTSGFISAITIIGTPAEFYIYGSMYSYHIFGFMVIAIISSEIYIPLFYRLRITSIYEYLEMRFDRSVRLLATVLFIGSQVLYISITIYAPALALSQTTGLDLWLSVAIAGTVCIFYTTMGGLKAVVWTDVFQVCVMSIGFVAILIRGSNLVGGFSKAWSIGYKGGRVDFVHFETDLRIRHTFWSLAIGTPFYWAGMYGTTQTVIQRFLCCKSEKHAKISVYLNSLGMTLFVTLAGLTGIVMYAYYEKCDPYTAGWVKASDQMAPYFVMDILHNFPGLPGMYLCSAFSGTLSTVSSGINAMAAVALEDYIKPYKDFSPRTLLWISKILVIVFGAICLAMVGVASGLGGIIEAGFSANGILLGPLLALFTMGWGCPWVNSKGSLAGVLSGVATTLWLYIGKSVYPVPSKFIRRLPLTTEECEFANSSFVSTSAAMAASPTYESTVSPVMNSEAERPPIAEFYTLSYPLHPVVGFLVCILVGTIVSFITGRQNPEEIPPGLTIAFFDHPVFRWLPEKVRKVLRCGVRYDLEDNENKKPAVAFQDSNSDKEIKVNLADLSPTSTDEDDMSEERSELVQSSNI